MKCSTLLLSLLAIAGVGITRAAAAATSPIAASAPTTTAGSVERNLFATEIFSVVAKERAGENVVVSPAALQTAMALIYYGATGDTANELSRVLHFNLGPGEKPIDVLTRYGAFYKDFTRDPNVLLANKILISEKLDSRQAFRDAARQHLDTIVEPADFHPPFRNKEVTQRVNSFVAERTNKRITAAMRADSLDDRTEAININGIAYRAPWQNAFDAAKTERRPFVRPDGRTTEALTMWTQNHFKYGDVAELDAKCIELPYKNPDYAMLVLLPNGKHGLADLERKLATVDLLALLDRKLKTETVEVLLPKFDIEYGIELKPTLEKLGVNVLFTGRGNLGNMYRTFINHSLSVASFKAAVAVDETGTEKPIRPGVVQRVFTGKKFEADHAFVFAIRFRDTLIFMGHFVQP